MSAFIIVASLGILADQTRPDSNRAASSRVAVVAGFDIPESARYDAAADLYYVSNVTGHPTAADNTGFISQIGPDGRIVNLKWIAGGINGVTLNGPKGLALDGDDLLVADVSVVRRFDRRTGRPKGVIDLGPQGARFLNDIGVGPDGSVLVSDTGLVFDDKGGASLTAPQRIFRIDRSGTVAAVVEGAELKAPNGVFYDRDRSRWLIAQLSGKDILEWTAERGLRVAATGPGGYDGIERLPDGRIVVTSQDGEGVFAIDGSAMTPIALGLGQTADLGIDTQRNRMAVPRLDNNTVEIWQISPQTSLTPRTGHAMATTGPDGGVLLVGGSPAAGDTAWRLDGNGWQALPPGGPTNRNMIAAAFDTRRKVLVAFGGVGMRNGSRYGETWEWDGRSWSERDVRGPGARDHHAMAYDEARGRVVMYGGMNGDHKGLQVDTWTWDGDTWTRAEEVSAPGGLAHHAMAYDARRQRVVMFGGITDNGPATGDVWEWDGSTWSSIPAPGPGRRSHIKLAYDAAREVVVMYGGSVPGGGPTAPPLTDTWTWDGRAWTRAATEGPAPRYLHAMAYDAGRRRVILVAGNRGIRPFDVLSDTWEWDGVRWTEARPPRPLEVKTWAADSKPSARYERRRDTAGSS